MALYLSVVHLGNHFKCGQSLTVKRNIIIIAWHQADIRLVVSVKDYDTMTAFTTHLVPV